MLTAPARKPVTDFESTLPGEATFLASRLIQDGVIRNLEAIGEATKNLSEDQRGRLHHRPTT